MFLFYDQGHNLMNRKIFFLFLILPPFALHGMEPKVLVSLLCNKNPQTKIEIIEQCDPNRADSAGQIPLSMCAYIDFCPEMRPAIYRLIARTSNLNHQDPKGKTALHHLVGNATASSADIQFLLDSGARWLPDAQGNSPLSALFIKDKPERLEQQSRLLMRLLPLTHITLSDIKKSLAILKGINTYHETKIEDLFLDLPLNQTDRIMLQWRIKNFWKQPWNSTQGLQGLKDILILDLCILSDRYLKTSESENTIEAQIRSKQAAEAHLRKDTATLAYHSKHFTPLKKSGRILKSYHETMRALGYINPHEKEWQASRQIPLSLPIAKKIAYFVSQQEENQ